MAVKSSKRELIDTGTDKRYVKRHKDGTFKESVDVDRSLAADRRSTSKTVAKPGYGDKGDQPKRATKKDLVGSSSLNGTAIERSVSCMMTLCVSPQETKRTSHIDLPSCRQLRNQSKRPPRLSMERSSRLTAMVCNASNNSKIMGKTASSSTCF